MTTKELFIKNKELRDKLLTITHSDWFGECLVYARSSMVSSINCSADELRGANRLIEHLLDLPEEESEGELVAPALEHNLDNPKPKAQSPTQKPKK